MKKYTLVAILVLTATTLSAAEPDAEQATTSDAIRRAYQALRPALVEVKVRVLADSTSSPERRSRLDALFDEFVDERLPLRLCGVRIAPTGTVLIRDPNLPLKRYGEIELLDGEGGTMKGRLVAVLENHAGILLEPVEAPESPLAHVTFSEANLNPGDAFFVAQPAFLEDMLSVQVEMAHAGMTAIEGSEVGARVIWWGGPSYSEMGRGFIPSVAPVVLDAEGRVIGLALDNALWHTAEGTDSWLGASIMNDKRLAPEALEAIGQRAIESSHEAVKEVQVRFRSDSRLAQQLKLEEAKLVLYGLLLDDSGKILVPTELDRAAIRQVERIDVLHEGKLLEAHFEGLYRDFGAFLVRADGLSGKPAPIEREATIQRGKVFFTLRVRRRYGKRQDEVEHNRYLDMAIGYKESHYPLPMRPLQVGEFVLNETGQFLGFSAPLRREQQDDIRAMSRRASQWREYARLYLFSEVAPLLENPKEHLDPAARPMSRKEANVLVWLGLEYQPVNAALAKALGAEGPTRGGARGLLITHVYDASPAERLGIKLGDILLSLHVPGAADEIDLAPPGKGRFARRSRNAARAASARRLWRSRRNYLTTILTLLGEGRRVRLRLIKEGQVQVVPLTLEKAPDDFDNADEYEDTVLGLTVREMTYEVRSVLRLPRESPGVAVSEVERGGKAAVAQIRPYEVITLVNEEPVKSPKEFERRIRSAIVGGRVELLVFNLGRSRIVEIDLGGESPH